MGDLSANFSSEEFACSCGCGLTIMAQELICRLQTIRYTLNVPMVVTSGARCATWNKKVGGHEISGHLYGCAVDILCENSEARSQIIALAVGAGIRRIGISKKFIHLDILTNAPQNVLWLY